MVPTPSILTQLCQAWCLDEPTRRRFAHALQHARWTAARDWYRAVQLADARVSDRRHVAETLLSPKTITRIVEALVQERRLERWWACRLEEKILRCTDSAGGWKK